MLKLIGLMVKISIFAIAVLVLSHYVRWNGSTISDQVKTQISHAERTEWASKVKSISSNISTGEPRAAARASASTAKNDVDQSKLNEEIASSERQKLRALIRDLNHSR